LYKWFIIAPTNFIVYIRLQKLLSTDHPPFIPPPFHFSSFLFSSLYPFTNGICTTRTSWLFVVALTRQSYFKSSVGRPRENHPSEVYFCLSFYPLGSNRKALINLAGFGHIINVGKVYINQHLVSALVERWRTETHIFHFSHGEATITLQDVVL